MTTQPKLTLKTIKQRSSAQSFSRGQSYYNSQRIYDTVQRGTEIQGYCSGSMPFPYFIRVSFAKNEIVWATCTCEYDWGGDCKHIVALMLTYLHEPEKFAVQASIDDALAKWEKVELISLINQMVEQYPDLYRLLQMPTPSQIKESQQPLDTSSLQAYIRKAFENYEGDYYDGGYSYEDHDPRYTSPYKAISDTQKNAQRFMEAGDWSNATRIYTIILEEAIVDGEKLNWDEDGSLVVAINDVIDDLAKCLANTEVIENKELRQRAFQSILGTVICNIVELGGVDLGYEGVNHIVRYARTEDLAELYQLLDLAEKTPSAQTSYGGHNWTLEALEEIRVQLETLDVSSIDLQLDRLREKGLYRTLAERLLDLGRGEEAIQIIHQYIDSEDDRFQLLRVLKAHGYADVALNIALESLHKPQTGLPGLHESWMRNWVIAEYRTRQDWDNLLKWAWVNFKEGKHIEGYKELKGYAQEAQRWDTIFSEITTYLEGKGDFKLLTHIYVEEGNASEAWEALDKLKAKPPSKNDWFFADNVRFLELEVGYATQTEFPERASAIMIQHAERLIEARGRENYREAAQHLLEACAIYQRMGKGAEWVEIINRIRTDNKQLRALQDELKKAKL